MNYIKSIKITGYKKFRSINVELNQYMNIMVGENEAGKSTILEAIKIVLNQQYKNSDKSVLRELFNISMTKSFTENPSLNELPYIQIELYLEINPRTKNSEYFYGEVNTTKKAMYGITFKCKFDEDLGSGLENDIKDGKIPYEYYQLSWETFSGMPYNTIKKPFNFIGIDTSNNSTNSTFNYYNRTLFNSLYDDGTRMGVKNSFRDKLNSAFDDIKLTDIGENRKFGINEKKVILESILSVYEDSIALENMGSGMENLIKTQIALDKSKSNLQVILLEEPENHLCFTNLNKMLAEISKRKQDTQIIIATHSNMIASRLNLNNVLWITDDDIISLKDVDEDVADFFVKAADNNFLQLLLSNKVILVEGSTESLLLPKIYKQIIMKEIEEDGVAIISCNGISYEKYLRIAEKTNKKIAVITDNDKDQGRIIEAEDFNKNHNMQRIFMGQNIGNWTWEACFYNLNSEALNSMISTKPGAKYLVKGHDYGQVLGKMLNNKVGTAYQMLISTQEYNIPQHLKDAILWVKK